MNQDRTLAPIVLFTYNRLKHLSQTVESLKQNNETKESNLFIFSDGPKNSADEEKINKIRAYVKTIEGFKSVTIIERTKNLGLATSIITGVTEIIEQFGKAIVVEDDLIFSPHFLKFMNDALSMYENDYKVMNVNGYFLSIDKKFQLPGTFFLRFISPLGWGTWKRAWQQFNPDARELLFEIKKRNAEYRFNIDGSKSFIHHLKANIIGRWNTWAIKWYANVFLKNGLTLFPSKSLVQHIGFDEEATHAKYIDREQEELYDKPVYIQKIPICESPTARKALRDYFLHAEKNPIKRYYKLFKENVKRIPIIKKVFDFLRKKVYNERNAI